MPNFGPGGSMAAGGRSVRRPGVSLIGDFTGVGPLLGGTRVSIPGFNNFTGQNLSHWQAARTSVVSGSSNTKVVDLSDSTGAGFGGAPSNINGSQFSRMAALATLLTNGGVPASKSSRFGDYHVAQAGGVPLTTFNQTILSLGSYASDSAGNANFGGCILEATAAGAPLQWQPSNNIDTFELFWAQNPGLGTFNYSVDSGSQTLLNQLNATLQVNKTTISAGTLGSHILKLAWASGLVWETGMVAFNSAVKEVSLINCGACGYTSAQLSTSAIALQPLPMIRTLAPSLMFSEGGVINDWVAGNSVATVQTNLQKIITNALSNNIDIILTTPNPSQPSGSGVSYAVQQTFVDMEVALARTNGIPCIDVWRLLGGTWENVNANGWAFDDLHLNGSGNAQVASFLNAAMVPGFISH